MSAGGVQLKFSSLRTNSAGEYVTRFVFGGAMSVIAGLAAQRYGPVAAGLLLAFPAIFPASATLLADHEKQKKQDVGEDGILRGCAAAAVDAEGAALGCMGLAAFAVIVWRMLPGHSAGLTLLAATGGWFVVAVVCWLLRRKF